MFDIVCVLEVEVCEFNFKVVDDVVYLCCMLVVENECVICQNELDIDIVVEQKKCQICEMQMEVKVMLMCKENVLCNEQMVVDVEFEGQCKVFVVGQVENSCMLVEVEVYCVVVVMQVLEKVDLCIVNVLVVVGMQFGQFIVQVFGGIVECVECIG